MTESQDAPKRDARGWSYGKRIREGIVFLAALGAVVGSIFLVASKYYRIQGELRTINRRIDGLNGKLAVVQESVAARRVPEVLREPARQGAFYEGEMGVLSPHDMLGRNSAGKPYDPDGVYCEINRYSTMAVDGDVCPGLLLVVENEELARYDQDGTSFYKSATIPAIATTADSLRPDRLGLLSPKAATLIGLTRNKGVTRVRVTVTAP